MNIFPKILVLPVKCAGEWVSASHFPQLSHSPANPFAITQYSLDRLQQRPALLAALLAELAQAQVHLDATAAQQAQDEGRQRILPRRILFGVGPLTARGPAAAQHIGMRERLRKPLPPARPADIEPELVRHGSIAHQKGVGRSQQDRIFRLALPTAHILRRDDAILHHLDVLAAEIGLGTDDATTDDYSPRSGAEQDGRRRRPVDRRHEG